MAPWQEGYSITSAPLYYDGLVVTGVSGGVMGRPAIAVIAAERNTMPAFRASYTDQ